MRWILCFFFCLSLLRNAQAWGPEGHMIVAQIAENQLSETAKKSINKLLEGQSLASVANWADTIKGQSEWAHTKSWHYADVPDGETYDSVTHSPEGDVITAIGQMVNVLKDQRSPLLEKQNAIKFIVHFAGDIHQPLHVGRPSDKGGNSIKLTFDGNESNLHQLWDSLMIKKQNMDYVQYSHYLETHGLMGLSYEIPEFPFRQIVTEDMAARSQIYSFKSDATPVILDNSYVSKNIETMNARLLLGGKRLAALFNALYK